MRLEVYARPAHHRYEHQERQRRAPVEEVSATSGAVMPSAWVLIFQYRVMYWQTMVESVKAAIVAIRMRGA